MTTEIQPRTVRRAVGYAAGLGVLWLAVAALRPETTFHLAPLLIAGVAAPALGIDAPYPGPRALAGMAAAGVAIALAGTGVLAVLDSLRGPSLLPVGGAVVESVVFAVAGGALGLVIALTSGRAR